MIQLGFIKDNSDRIEMMKLWEHIRIKELTQSDTV